MKVGDLVRIPGEVGNLWMVVRYAPHLRDSAQDVLIQSVKTGYRMWGLSCSFEVISESR